MRAWFDMCTLPCCPVLLAHNAWNRLSAADRVTRLPHRWAERPLNEVTNLVVLGMAGFDVMATLLTPLAPFALVAKVPKERYVLRNVLTGFGILESAVLGGRVWRHWRLTCKHAASVAALCRQLSGQAHRAAAAAGRPLAHASKPFTFVVPSFNVNAMAGMGERLLLLSFSRQIASMPPARWLLCGITCSALQLRPCFAVVPSPPCHPLQAARCCCSVGWLTSWTAIKMPWPGCWLMSTPTCSVRWQCCACVSVGKLPTVYTSGWLSAAAAVQHESATHASSRTLCVAGRHSAESLVQQLLHTACINLAAGLAGKKWREVQVGFAFQPFIVLNAVC